MPQADDALRNRMNDHFGSHTDDVGPIKFLQDAGYTLNRDWTWSKTGVGDLAQMTRDEFDCLMFLVHEWDLGGLAVADTEKLDQPLRMSPSPETDVGGQAGKDVRILLEQIEFLEGMTGEKLEDEDAALVAQIKASYPAFPAGSPADV